MLKKFVSVLRSGALGIALALAFSPASFPKGSHSTYHSSHASRSDNSAGKTEHVNGYYRKDGTYVHDYNRHPAGTASDSNHLADPLSTVHPLERDSRGGIKRSASAKNAFKREYPCPSTSRASGACPGYVIDHVKPLECGGADAPSNMQWQTIADAKIKDRTEGQCRWTFA